MNSKKLRYESGIILIEAMIAIIIFSFGILGLLGAQANAVKIVLAAKNRADASNLVDQIVGQMWADRPNLVNYAHMAAAGAGTCIPGGAASANANVINWLSLVSATLPGAKAMTQQIKIAAGNVVTVTVCWQLPQETTPHNFSESAQING